MTDTAARPASHWPSLVSSALAAIVVGFASTILLVIEGVRAVGGAQAQQASAAAILCLGMAATSFLLAWRYKMPIITAWSTPGSVLIATSAAGISWPEAVGAFMAAGLLMVITALVTPLERAIERMPASIAAAMLAGVLLRYVLGVPGAALSSPVYVLPLAAAFFALRIVLPIYAVPVVVLLGLAMAAFGGSLAGPVTLGLTPLVFEMPVFDWQAILGLGLPLYLVTMASQNLPGFAVLRASGYNPPVSACLGVTGIASMAMAPFGAHALNMSAITASLVAGPDTHPDPGQRWKMIYAYSAIYALVGLAAATFVMLLTALPKDLVAAIAGLALFGPLMGGMTAMMREPKQIEPALLTFMITASGIGVLGVGAAFWGLVAGLALWGIKRLAGQ
jgi:benzoate membrane transport protein